jgi:WD40 repeat protein
MFRHLLIILLIVLNLGWARAQTASTPEILWAGVSTNPYILNPIAVSPDEKFAATLGTNHSLQIWQTVDGTPVTSLIGHSHWIGTVQFSPDGKRFVSSGGDKTVRVWNTEDWSLAYLLTNSQQGPAVAFSADSTLLAVGQRESIELRNATNGALIHNWIATTGKVSALAFSPKENELASGAGVRGADIHLKIWAIPSGQLVRSIQTAQSYGVGAIAFSPDGQLIATGSEYLSSGPMQLWRTIDGQHLKTFAEPAFSMAFSPDGLVLASIGTNISFSSVSNGSLIQKYLDGSLIRLQQGQIGIAFIGNDRFVRTRGFGEVFVARAPFWISESTFENARFL